jgi:hypothetical protein
MITKLPSGVRWNVFVERASWLRGEGAVYSYLHRPDDSKKCCLGFAENQIFGIEFQDMVRHVCPAASPKELNYLDWRSVVDEEYCAPTSGMSITGLMMDINDRTTLDDSDRERQLTLLADEIGIHLIFY